MIYNILLGKMIYYIFPFKIIHIMKPKRKFTIFICNFINLAKKIIIGKMKWLSFPCSSLLLLLVHKGSNSYTKVVVLM